jgi:hypothetical protein
VRDGDKEATDWARRKAKCFARANWTTQIRLNQLKKSNFARTSFSADQVASVMMRHSEIALICPSGRKRAQALRHVLDRPASLSFSVIGAIELA